MVFAGATANGPRAARGVARQGITWENHVDVVEVTAESGGRGEERKEQTHIG